MSSDNLDDTFHEPNPGFKALLSKWQTQDAFGGGAAGSTSSHITKYAFRKSRQVAQTEYRERKTSDKDYKASEKAIEEEKPKAVVAPARKSGDARPKKPTGPRPQHLNNVYQKPLEDVSGFKPPVYPKNALEKELIQTALRKNFVFSDLGAQSLAPMVDAFEQCSFETDAMIIRQGDPGDFFYIIKSGKVIFEVNGKDVGRAGEGASFGELSLLYTVRVVALLDAKGRLPCAHCLGSSALALPQSLQQSHPSYFVWTKTPFATFCNRRRSNRSRRRFSSCKMSIF